MVQNNSYNNISELLISTLKIYCVSLLAELLITFRGFYRHYLENIIISQNNH